MILVFKNYELKSFGEFLYDLSLKGKESRMRSRFIDIIEEQGELINKEKNLLLEDFAKKDEEGNIKTDVDEQGRAFAVLEDAVSYQIELAKLMNEEFVLNVTADKKEMVKTVQTVVLECDKEFSGVEAERYNRFCEILESITFDETI